VVSLVPADEANTDGGSGAVVVSVTGRGTLSSSSDAARSTLCVKVTPIECECYYRRMY
jgi:hypothetical protein